MEGNDSTLNIDELARKIEERIKELEKNDSQKKVDVSYDNKTTNRHLVELDEIIAEIDARIDELEKKENITININDLTEKVNKKLENVESETNDLSKISDSVNEMIKALEDKRKKRKKQKAMYCDLARKKANAIKKKKSKK